MGLIFLSYRRDDSGALAYLLADELLRTFGESQLFLDIDRIRVASDWKKQINIALAKATLLVPIIGRKWLMLQDSHGRRRLDLADDWVRTEIESALERGIPILPVLVDGVEFPIAEALPDGLHRLANFQAYSISGNYFKRDVAELLSQLRGLGFTPIVQSAKFPAKLDTTAALSESNLAEEMKGIPNWQVSDGRSLPDGTGRRRELYRHFVFGSFEDAIHFMMTASRYAQKTDHHPEWSNLWVNLKVWLTTWDIGFQPTWKDIRLAQYLEALYNNYTHGTEQSQGAGAVLPLADQGMQKDPKR